MLAQAVQAREHGPFLGLQGPGRLLQPRELQLGPQQIALVALPHLVPRAGQPFGLFEEDGLLRQQLLLPPDEEQGRVAPPHIGLQAHLHAGARGLGHIHTQGSRLLAEAPLTRPGEGLREGDAVVARLHLADHEFLEAVVLQTQRQRGIRQHTRLRDALSVHAHGGIGLLEVGMFPEGFGQQGRQDGVGLGRRRGGRGGRRDLGQARCGEHQGRGQTQQRAHGGLRKGKETAACSQAGRASLSPGSDPERVQSREVPAQVGIAALRGGEGVGAFRGRSRLGPGGRGGAGLGAALALGPTDGRGGDGGRALRAGGRGGPPVAFGLRAGAAVLHAGPEARLGAGRSAAAAGLMRLVRLHRRPDPGPAAQEQHDGQDGAQDQPHGETSGCFPS